MYSSKIQRLIADLKDSNLKDFYGGEELSRVQVDDFVSKVAGIYEKIRNAIEYKEDNLLRKSAIFRILQRKMMIKVSAENLPLSLIKELIRAGYLENNLIPQSRVAGVQEIIEKYLAVFNLSSYQRATKAGNQLFKWLLELAACEIEEFLMPPVADKSLVEFMYQLIRPKINIIDKSLSDQEKNLHVYLAVYRALVKSDDSMIDFLLLKYYSPGWRGAQTDQIIAVAKKIYNLKLRAEKQRKLYSSGKLFRLFKKYTFVFFVLRDIILEKPKQAAEIFSNPETLEYHIRERCQKNYHNAKIKLRRSIVRVTIYIFITKMLLALLLEIPYDRYIAQQVDYLPLVINALFPPLLILISGIFIRVPSKKNTESVVKLSKEIVYHNTVSGLNKSGVEVSVKRANVFNFIFNVLYLILFVFSFGVLIYILKRLSFSSFSIFIFLLFLSVVSFFAIKMRLKIKELLVLDKKENPLVFLINLFTLPFLRVGHWLSEKFSKINVFVFILDFIIEAPFKIFLEVIEDWIAFLKEKREEIYNKD